MLRREAPHSRIHRIEPCLFKVGEVHRYLHQASRTQRQPQSLHSRQAAAAGPYAARDLLGDAEIVRLQVDVEGDQEFAGPCDHRAGGWMQSRSAHIRLLRLISRSTLSKTLELSPSYILELAPLGS